MKTSRTSQISRKEFLKFAGLSLSALALPVPLLQARLGEQWPSLTIDRLPVSLAEIFRLVPDTAIDEQGYLTLSGRDGLNQGRVPLVRTQWNLEHESSRDRLLSGIPWGIVLHWFGDPETKDLDVSGYLRGFNGRRKEEDTLIRTSAHYLVGDARPSTVLSPKKIGLLQTQAPYKDGTPLQASHVRGLSFGTHAENKQYFVRAYYELAKRDPSVYSLLQEMYDGRWIHPNERTIAIEITGTNFEQNFPSPQKLANVIGLVWAIMKRYKIPASHILGHHEMQMNKGDPGKQFMATMRYLIGLKALLEGDPIMKLVVFGQHVGADGDVEAAVERYFNLVRDYHVLVSTPQQVYEWETLNQYWFIQPQIAPNQAMQRIARGLITPIAGEFIINGYEYLNPENHEGVDLHHPILRGTARPSSPADVRLIADGECMYMGKVHDCHIGQVTIFRHLKPDGARYLSIYGHLSEMSDLKIGQEYAMQTQLGRVDNLSVECGRFLHFAIAYGAAWDLDLHRQPKIPLGAGPSWIRSRYLEPLKFLESPQTTTPIQTSHEGT